MATTWIWPLPEYTRIGSKFTEIFGSKRGIRNPAVAGLRSGNSHFSSGIKTVHAMGNAAGRGSCREVAGLRVVVPFDAEASLPTFLAAVTLLEKGETMGEVSSSEPVTV